LAASALTAGAGSNLLGDDIDIDLGVHDGFVAVVSNIGDSARSENEIARA
jgi:hypothetical protein